MGNDLEHHVMVEAANIGMVIMHATVTDGRSLCRALGHAGHCRARAVDVRGHASPIGRQLVLGLN